MLSDAIGKLHPAVAQTVGHFVDALMELDRDLQSFVGKQALVLGDPHWHVEIVPRHRGESELLHHVELR